MPVYEIVLRESPTSQKVSFDTRAVTMLGDVVIVDNEHWIVVGKEPPFGLRNIERLICESADLAPRCQDELRAR